VEALGEDRSQRWREGAVMAPRPLKQVQCECPTCGSTNLWSNDKMAVSNDIVGWTLHPNNALEPEFGSAYDNFYDTIAPEHESTKFMCRDCCWEFGRPFIQGVDKEEDRERIEKENGLAATRFRALRRQTMAMFEILQTIATTPHKDTWEDAISKAEDLVDTIKKEITG
jgi:hypothetical protein